MYRVTEAIGGDLPEFWGTDLEWEIGLTYSYIKDVQRSGRHPGRPICRRR